MRSVQEWFKERFPSIIELTKFHATEYPTPPNLNYSWAFGVLIMFFFAVQVITGIAAAIFYKPHAVVAFESIERFRRYVHWGWLLQSIHAVAPTFIFAAIYAHIGRGIYYGSYKAPREIVWFIGVFLLMVMMMESFMGYVLPWGQMSYWAGTVITGLASVLPVVGGTLVTWIRGDYLMSDATLSRFYSFHIALFPLAIIGGLIVLHIMALHDVGSNNPIGVQPRKENKVPFYPYYVVKDFYVVGLVFTFFLFIIFFYPNLFLEAENFQKANPSITPAEIKPEWYFLPFFAMLRSIPSKLLGAVVLWLSLWVFLFLPFIDRSPVKSNRYRPVKRWMDIVFFVNFAVLGYLGAHPPMGGYLPAARIATLVYFGYFALLFAVSLYEKKPEELIAYENDTSHIRLHAGSKNIVWFSILIIALGAINVRAFTFNFPTMDTIEKGRAVYEAKGRMCHDMLFMGEQALLSPEDRAFMLGMVPPDISLKAKSMDESGIRVFLSRFIGKAPEGSKMAVVFTPEEVDQLAAFLQYSSDPSLFLRGRIGPWAVLFMSVFTVFLYLLYKEVWRLKALGLYDY
ncbi:MAG: cytochrome b N-terminal domain-containing protein [Deltaproteobacteria bacterium]|nr:cytochrome b N-terminal domain-containing protein [Deltaproteobacteria bacterium]